MNLTKSFFFSVIYKNENEESKKYCIKAKFEEIDVYLITYSKKVDKKSNK